jgi:concentrative nucleoside transporter, CNT family
VKSRSLISLVVFVFFATIETGFAADGGPVPASVDAGLRVVSPGASASLKAKDAGVDSDALRTPKPSEEQNNEAEKQVPPNEKKTILFSELQTNDKSQSFAERYMGILGCFITIGLAILMSTNRRRISWKLVATGVGLQLGFAFLVLKTGVGSALFQYATDAVNRLLSFSVEGSRFVFGNLVDPSVAVSGANGESIGYVAQTGSMIAFGILPTILFFSALTSLMYHLGILQRIVKLMAWVMKSAMGTSGAESLSAAANIFVGQTEAPLVIRPYLDRMTQSELMAVMTGGFATVAGGVMAVYVGLLSGIFPDIAGHLLAASVMSAPASLVMAKIMIPETQTPVTANGTNDPIQESESDGNQKDNEKPANALDAISKGTSDGLLLCLNVGAMLITFVALVALFNWCVGGMGSLFGVESLTLQRILGWVMAPLAFVLGVPWADAVMVGGLMGTKTVVNEFVAFLDLASLLQSGELQSAKSVVIATYALCGFSNLASIGIQIGGLSTIAPSRRADLARLGFRSMIAASLACFQTAALAGILL